MPRAALKPCAQAGCPALVARGRCPKHRSVHPFTFLQGRELSPEQRKINHARYGPEWRRTRIAVLTEEPHCAFCGAAATDVDHIVALSRGGTNDRENLRALCHSCHMRRTFGDTLRGWNHGRRAAA